MSLMATDSPKSGYYSYYAAMDAVMAAEAKGIGAYEMCIASELTAAVKERCKAMRHKKAKDMLLGSVEELYRIAIDVYHGSGCASTPKDAAHGTVKCFIQCGMDAKKTESYAKSKMFALIC